MKLLESEEWKRVLEFPEYYVSNMGRVMSVKVLVNKQKKTRRVKNTLLSIFKVKGYHAVNFHSQNKRKSARVHILVINAFGGTRPLNADVMHLDGNPLNNHISNLRYGSRKCNEAFKIDHGTDLTGERHHQAVMKEQDVLDIREMLSRGIKGTELATMYDVTPSCISYIKLRKSWKHL